VCAIGEAEGTLLETAQQIARGATRSDPGWLSGVDGVAYGQGDQVIYTRPRALAGDLNDLPFPAHHLLGLADYAPHPNTGVKSTGMVTYRGCPKQCVFCCNPLGPQVRLRDPVRVVDEMAQVRREHDVQGFNVYDNLFGLNRDHALAVCQEIIQRGLDIVWDCWTAGDLIDAELAAKMRAAGCVRVGFGAESGDDGVLMKARRGFTSGQHRTGIEALKAAGLTVEAFFMVGLPGESADTVRHTVEFAANCGANAVCLSLHRPWPGTAVWGAPEAFSVRITRGPDFEAYIETEALSRSALLECTERANEELVQRGLSSGVLRYDRYGWE
jgi:anaerobic magnesium-protoporphyrin IX monomethyl ester cyclase